MHNIGEAQYIIMQSLQYHWNTVLPEDTGVPRLLNKLSIWKSTRKIDEKFCFFFFSAMGHPVFTSSTFCACWCVLECCTLVWTHCQPPACLCLLPPECVFQAEAATLQGRKGSTRIQRTAVSRQLARFPEHSKGLWLQQDKVPHSRGQISWRTDPPHTWHNILPHLTRDPPTGFSPVQGGSGVRKIEVKSVFLRSESIG